jgi:putative two-component system response regulator
MQITPYMHGDRMPECVVNTSDCRVMIVDDDQEIRDVLRYILESEGYSCTVAQDGEAAYERIKQFEPDVVITDVDMPKMDGIALIKLVKTEFDTDVIVMTGFTPDFSYSEFIEMGASDFVQKPVMPSEMVTRLQRVLRERCYRMEAKSAHQKLIHAHEDLQSSYLDTIHRLVLAAEHKDEDTGDHIIRIGRFCALLARKLGLPEEEIETIGYAAPMHDIGKMGIPDRILLKPGKLTPQEFDIIKTHTTIGARILANSKSEVIRCAQQIAISHHERWDGNGYPRELRSDRIPLVGRIVTLADTFDALTSRRPYKSPYPLDLALEIMGKERGCQFDPLLFDLFMDNIDAIVAIKGEVPGIKVGELGDFILSERDRAA